MRLQFSYAAAVLLTFWLLYDKSGNASLSVAAAILHECGHLLTLCAMGDVPSKLCFGVFGMRIERAENVRLSYRKECFAAFAGPMMNLLLWGVFHICGSELGLRFSEINAALAFFNLLPIRPMDGGQMLYAVLCSVRSPMRAEKICKKIAVCGVIPLTAIALWSFVSKGWNFTLLLSAVYVLSLLLP